MASYRKNFQLYCTDRTFVMDVIRHLGKLNVGGKCVNDTSTSVTNFKIDRGYLSQQFSDYSVYNKVIRYVIYSIPHLEAYCRT